MRGQAAQEQFDFSGFAEDFGFGAPLTETPDGATVQAGQEPQPPQQPPTQPTQPTPSPAVPRPPPQPQPTSGLPQSVGQLVDVLHGNEDALVNSLLPEFALDQETITALETDAAQEVPKLLAKTYTKAVTESMRLLNHFVPGMIQHSIARAVFGMQADATFFKMNSDLNREAHGETIKAIGPGLRAQYPQLGIPEFMRMLGNVVRTAHGLPPQQQSAPAMQRPQPFVPAQSNGGRVIAPPTPVASPFEGLGMEFDN